MNTNIIHKELAYRVIGSAMEVYNEMGYGFLERVYENALMIALSDNNIHARQQYPIDVIFRNQQVGQYIADIVIENKILIELKANKNIAPEHIAQTLNYLKATGYRLGLVINFAEKELQYKRLIL